MIQRPSPNFDARPEGQSVDILLLHYTGMPSGAEALARMCSAEAKVSAHYMVEENGDIYQLVDEDNRAWHAGVGSWQGMTDINAASVGIEIVNPGHEFGYRPFPRKQIEAVISLSKAIMGRHAIQPERVLGHSDVAPTRKEDPGELFPWSWLAGEGVGVFLDPASVRPGTALELQRGDAGDSVRTLQKRFRAFGYGLEVTAEFDLLTEAVVTAFQRHYRPENMTGVADAPLQALLRAYLARAGIAV